MMTTLLSSTSIATMTMMTNNSVMTMRRNIQQQLHYNPQQHQKRQQQQQHRHHTNHARPPQQQQQQLGTSSLSLVGKLPQRQHYHQINDRRRYVRGVILNDSGSSRKHFRKSEFSTQTAITTTTSTTTTTYGVKKNASASWFHTISGGGYRCDPNILRTNQPCRMMITRTMQHPRTLYHHHRFFSSNANTLDIMNSSKGNNPCDVLHFELVMMLMITSSMICQWNHRDYNKDEDNYDHVDTRTYLPIFQNEDDDVDTKRRMYQYIIPLMKNDHSYHPSQQLIDRILYWQNIVSNILPDVLGLAIVTTQCTSSSSFDHVNRDDMIDASGYTESDRFYQCLQYHRALLYDYQRRWGSSSNDGSTNKKSHNNIAEWPSHIPSSQQLPSLIMDLDFCYASLLQQQQQQQQQSGQQNHNHNDNESNHHNHFDNNMNHYNNIMIQQKRCHDQQFKIASYYVRHNHYNDDNNANNDNDDDMKKYGYKLIKELAEQGHADSMCLLGILLNEGRIPGIDMNPKLAVRWWRRCVDENRHICAMYELGNAYYLGEGVAENPAYAVRLFIRSANLGHPGAAYMLGQCLLDGVGLPRDRANALEWLVTAAELGHPLAQQRILFILQEGYQSLHDDDQRHSDQPVQNHDVKDDDDTKIRNQDTQKDVTLSTTKTNESINVDESDHTSSTKKKTDDDNNNNDGKSQSGNEEEVAKWMNAKSQINRKVNIERHYTVGGGSSNPAVLATRKTKVAESRGHSSSSS